jgi:iron complex outermembrane recepter protein
MRHRPLLCRVLCELLAVVAAPAMVVVGSGDAAAQAPADVVPPVVLSHVDAVYPPSALAERKHGDVVLAVTVDADGHVSMVEVLESGGAALDEAAIIAVRQWTFRPAMRGDKPVASRIKVPFHFAPPAPPPEVVEPPPPAEPELPSQPAVGAAPSPPPAAPAPPAPPPAAPPEKEGDAGEVFVVGRRQPPSRGASDFNLKVGELARVPRANATELLELAPGILLTNEGGEGHAEQVFLRGFDAREGQDIEFSVDGVPINESGNLHGNGHADTHFILPELVESLRVVEGPFDPRQGNYAVAGSANYELGLARRGLTAKYMRGSFGTERLLLLWGPEGQSKRTFAGGELFKSDGFGKNRDSQRGSAMAQYEVSLADKATFHLTGTAYATNYHSAGVVRDDDYRAGRIGFFDTYDFGQGGDASRYSIAADVETHAGAVTVGQQVFLVATSMRLRENFTGFLLDVQEPIQSLHEQRGDLLDLDTAATTIGARGSGRFKAQAFGQTQELELGYFARADSVKGSQQRVESATGHPYLTETALESRLSDIALYGDANLRATPWLALRGGLRGDLFTFDVDDLCAVHDVSRPSKANPPGDASCLDQQAFGRHREPNQRASTASVAVLPRASVFVGPFAHVTLSASYGKGIRSIDPNYITQDIKTPFASIAAYEAGLSYAGTVQNVELLARSVFFQTHVDRDLIFSETEGRNVLSNGTTRRGWVGAVRATGAFFDEAANLTLVKSSFDDTSLLVPYVPDVVLRSDSSVFADLPWELAGKKVRGALGAGLTYVGKRALPYGQRSDTIFTLDGSATASWSNFELGLMVTNLLDRRYRLGEYNFASDFHADAGSAPTLVPVRHFTAGAPRAIYGTLGINFGGS